MCSSDLNAAATDTAPAENFKRLDWDYTGTGEYLNPGAYLPTPTNLTIDFTSDMYYRVAGGVTGADQTVVPASDANVVIDNPTPTITWDGTLPAHPTHYKLHLEIGRAHV